VRPNVLATLRAVFLLVALCVLAITQTGIARSDDPLSPVLPLTQPVFEPVTQWGSSTTVSLPPTLPDTWVKAAPLAPIQPMPSLTSPSLQIQPVAQWTKFDVPKMPALNPPTAAFSNHLTDWNLTGRAGGAFGGLPQPERPDHQPAL
jgi:hypothetical protein